MVQPIGQPILPPGSTPADAVGETTTPAGVNAPGNPGTPPSDGAPSDVNVIGAPASYPGKGDESGIDRVIGHLGST